MLPVSCYADRPACLLAREIGCYRLSQGSLLRWTESPSDQEVDAPLDYPKRARPHSTGANTQESGPDTLCVSASAPTPTCTIQTVTRAASI